MGRLFWKFFFFTLLAQLIATVGIGGAIALKNHLQERKAIDLDLGPPAAYHVEAAAATLRYGGSQALRELLKARLGRHPVYAVDAAGRDILQRDVSPHLIEEARTQLGGGRLHNAVQAVRAPDGRSYLLFSPALHPAAPPALDNPPPPDAPQWLPRDLHERHASLPHMAPEPPHLLSFLPIASAIGASLVFAALLAAYFSKPIRSLHTAFDSLASGNLDTQVMPAMGGRRDELTDLGRDFDHMANRLRALVESQQRLLHDVSHELRSPLARMQVAIGLARQNPDKLHASLDRIERESERMDALLGELLTLSRLEAGETQQDDELIDIDAFMQDIIDDAQIEADAAGCSIIFDGACDKAIRGSAELLRRALENVVRNAIKHSPSCAQVHVQTRCAPPDSPAREAGWFDIIVSDQGPGVPSHELTAIFEPFVRGSNTRGQSSGHGLGLAIARRVIEGRGGRIRAINQPQGGLRIEIALPL